MKGGPGCSILSLSAWRGTCLHPGLLGRLLMAAILAASVEVMTHDTANG